MNSSVVCSHIILRPSLIERSYSIFLWVPFSPVFVVHLCRCTTRVGWVGWPDRFVVSSNVLIYYCVVVICVHTLLYGIYECLGQG